MITINTRVIHGKTTGVQRYVLEMLKFLSPKLNQMSPKEGGASGSMGHLWEQVILPIKLKNSPLWSPAATGPLFYNTQVVTIHDVSPLDHPDWFGAKFAKWYSFVLPKICQNSKHIITDSYFSKERIVQTCRVPDNKVSVVYLGGANFDIPLSEPSPVLQLQLPFQRYFLVVGSLEPRKNTPRLIQAWKTLKGKIPADMGLVFAGGIGKSEIFANMSIEVSESDKVYFTGHVDDTLLQHLYKNCYGFIYPSLYEGFGLPPLEAMSLGAPVLTSNTTALGEIAGKAAITFNPTDVNAIAESIILLANDEKSRIQMTHNSIEYVKKFSWKNSALETYAILEKHLS